MDGRAPGGKGWSFSGGWKGVRNAAQRGSLCAPAGGGGGGGVRLCGPLKVLHGENTLDRGLSPFNSYALTSVSFLF